MFTNDHKINFNFLPPTPRRTTGLIKHRLHHMTGDQLLTTGEFTGLSTHMEVILNSTGYNPFFCSGTSNLF